MSLIVVRHLCDPRNATLTENALVGTAPSTIIVAMLKERDIPMENIDDKRKSCEGPFRFIHFVPIGGAERTSSAAENDATSEFAERHNIIKARI